MTILDYKEKLPNYLTESVYENWKSNKKKEDKLAYLKLLKLLGIKSYQELLSKFDNSQDERYSNIIKFFWYRLLTRAGMIVPKFDCDKAFFGSISNKVPVAEPHLINNWQRRKLNEGWGGDTANSFYQLFKKSLVIFDPNMFNGIETNDKLSSVLRILAGKYNTKIAEIESVLSDIPQNDIHVVSYLIYLREELFDHLANGETDCTVNDLDSINEFAKLTHTVGNFIVLQKGDNLKKNSRYEDFMDLYIRDHKNFGVPKEELLKKQNLSMYQEPLFERSDGEFYPNNIKQLRTTINHINERIKMRQEMA